MNKFFNYYNSLCSGENTPTVFAYDPYITSVKTILAEELKQIVFYIEKLKNFGEDMSLYRDKVIEFISVLLFNSDFKRESFFVIISDLYKNKLNLKEKYTTKCYETDTEIELFPGVEIDLSSKNTVLKLLNDNEKNISSKGINVSERKKVFYSIIMSLVLNACNCLIELKNYGEAPDGAKDEVLALINSANYPLTEDAKLKKKIKEFTDCNYKIMKKLYSAATEKFGPVVSHKLPLSVKKGKAILVSGTSLSDLENILNTVKDTDINVYTHHEMFRAFMYEKFLNYKNLAGHYQVYNNNFRSEFSSFPGPVYISVNSIPKIDLIRGQIYTGAKYPEYGTGKIENGDFSVLANVALKSPGFTEETGKQPLTVGYSLPDVIDNINNIINLYKDGKIKHLFVVGVLDMFADENEYIEKFFDESPDDVFIISFAYHSDKNNFWQASASYDFNLLYFIIEQLKNNSDKITDDMSVLIADCNISTLSHIFNLIYLGINNIFTGACCPNIINPVLMNGLSKEYGIHSLTTPENDIKKSLKKEED